MKKGNQPRRYRKRRRAQQEAETRERITAAAVALHGSVGPAATTLTAVADAAGVQRATVYRHFPDEETLYAACSAHWYALNPPPAPAQWRAIADPDERLHQGLTQLYCWYAWAEPMLDKTLRDAPRVPAMAPAMAQFDARFAALREALLWKRPQRGQMRRRTAAAIGHALDFFTWRSLVRRQGLPAAVAVSLLTQWVGLAGCRA